MKVVIGYGSTLHSDDAVGCRVAEIVQAWQWPDVWAIAAPQLLPEHTAALAQAELAVFVDAIDDPEANGCGIDRLTPNLAPDAAPASNHFNSPQNLLALTHKLFGVAPMAYQVAIPGRNFGLGFGLSSVAAHGIETALWAVKGLCAVG